MSVISLIIAVIQPERSLDRAMTSIPLIVERLERLPPEKLLVVYDFVSYLEERTSSQVLKEPRAEAYGTMLASEAVLRRDWDTPDEDSAWADL